jgi:hypothetical protein
MDKQQETPLARAERHVAEFERRVSQQTAIVNRLRAQNSNLIAGAERLLTDFQISLAVAREHLRIERERPGDTS